MHQIKHILHPNVPIVTCITKCTGHACPQCSTFQTNKKNSDGQTNLNAPTVIKNNVQKYSEFFLISQGLLPFQIYDIALKSNKNH